MSENNPIGDPEQIYPKPRHRKRERPDRRWHVRYEQMAYDGGGSSSWTGYHRTRLGALIAAWWQQNIASWGGRVTLTDTAGVRNDFDC